MQQPTKVKSSNALWQKPGIFQISNNLQIRSILDIDGEQQFYFSKQKTREKIYV
jgi:hypothetical protein